MIKKYSSFPCSAPWDGAFIYGNGDVYPCCRLFEEDKLLLGNLNDNTFEEVLNSESAWKLREAWVTGEGLEEYPCDKCFKEWSHYCQTYFREDVEKNYFEKSYKVENGSLNRIRFEPFKPKRLEFQISQDCMLDCNFCHRNEVPKGKEGIKSVKYLDADQLIEIAEYVDKDNTEGCTVFTHGNAEPLMHPEREKIFTTLGQKAMLYTNITTNAVALTKSFVDKIVKLPSPPTVHVSIYGPDRETYKKVTGRDALNKVLDNVHYLLEQRSLFDTKRVMSVTMAIVITPENEPKLHDFLDMCSNMFLKFSDDLTICFNDVGFNKRSKISILADMERTLHPSMVRGFWKVEAIKAEHEFDLLTLDNNFNKEFLMNLHPDKNELKMVIRERIEACLFYSRNEEEKAKYQNIKVQFQANQELFN